MQKHGLDCHVFEQAPRLEVGAGLLLTPQCGGCVGGPESARSTAAHALITPAWHILDPQGRDLQVLRPFRPVGRRSAPGAATCNGCSPEPLRPIRCISTTRRRRWFCSRTAFGFGSAIGPTSWLRWSWWRTARRRNCEPCPRARPLRDQGYVGWRALSTGRPLAGPDGRVTETWGSGRRFGIAAVGGGRTYWYASADTDLIEPYSALSRRELLAACFTDGMHPWRAHRRLGRRGRSAASDCRFRADRVLVGLRTGGDARRRSASVDTNLGRGRPTSFGERTPGRSPAAWRPID
ncbi:MAG: hypothetical protein IPL60_17745 [Ardenticatenia bacterium]|nr:hypothetical protein [Ardenticatenia bacterium]